MALRIENCVATPSSLAIFFSEAIRPAALGTLTVSSVNPVTAEETAPLTPALPSFSSWSTSAPKIGQWYYDANALAISIALSSAPTAFREGNLIKVEITDLDGGVFYTQVQSEQGAGGNGGLKGPEADLQSYPVLTEEVPAGATPSTTRPATVGTGAGTSALAQTAEKAVREVLSWRTKSNDPKGFVTALSQAFDLKEVEGHTEWTWTPRSYTVQTDLGAVTGAQASIYTRAKVALDQSLPLLDGLYPLVPTVEAEDLKTVQSVVRSQFTALVNEFGVEGGPRVPRIDELFELLLGDESPKNPESAGGSLGLVGQRFGLQRNYVTTVEDEQNLTNYLILVDYVMALNQSWKNDRGYFLRNSAKGKPPFFGTHLVLLSRSLDAVAQSVQDAYFAMDSVFMGDAERQTAQLDFAGLTVWLPIPKTLGLEHKHFDRDTSGLFVAELLDWVDRAVSEELPHLLQDAGKDGLHSVKSVVKRLRKFVYGAMVPPQRTTGLPPGYYTPRVKRALRLLADGLDETYRLASQIDSPDLPGPVSARGINRIDDELRKMQEEVVRLKSEQAKLLGGAKVKGGTHGD